MSSLPLRPCVVGVFVNDEGLLLVGERSDAPGAFQFPQGGIDPGESPQEALVREMREEIGVQRFEIVRAAAEWLGYDFPPNFHAKVARKFRGQTQKWFLLRLFSGELPDLSNATDQEFTSLRWMERDAIVRGVISWKRDAYSRGLQLLFQENQ